MILASQSPRRRQILEEAGFEFRTLPSSFDESRIEERDPRRLVLHLAAGKASGVCDQAEAGEIVIGSDTVVVLDGAVLGKPKDAGDARNMLERLSGRTHKVLTAVSLWRDGHEAASFVETTAVSFWPLSAEEIAAYVATGEPLDKAGAYGIQGRGRLFVKGIEGDFYNVVGLPVAHLARELRHLGFYGSL